MFVIVLVSNSFDERSINNERIVELLTENKVEQKGIREAIDGMRKVLIDLTGIVQNLQTEKATPQPVLQYNTISELNHLEQNLKSSKHSRDEFYIKLQAIKNTNKDAIGSNITHFYKTCLKTLFTAELLTQITWTYSPRKFRIGSSQIGRQIELYGSVIDQKELEGNRIKLFQRSLKAVKDSSRKIVRRSK